MSNGVKLSPPWVKYFREMEALFKNDPHIRMTFDEDNYVIKLYVEGAVKAEALTALLPAEKVFGNVTVKTEVIPANLNAEDPLELFKAAFEGNPTLSYVKEGSGVFKDSFKYVVFRPEVVQFFNDDLGDVNGYCSTLYQDIAKDIFTANDNVYFCTEAMLMF